MDLAELETEAILRVLADTDGNRADTGRILGPPGRTQYRKLRLFADESPAPQEADGESAPR